MKEIEQLFSEIKSNNKHEAKSIFDGIIADKVTKALDARKAAIAQQRFNESTYLEEGSMDKMSLQDLWMDFTSADFQVDQGYGIGKGSPKWNGKKQDAIYNYVRKKFGRDVADDMADYGATATYADEYADADEAPKAKKHLAKLAKKHGIKESKQIVEKNMYDGPELWQFEKGQRVYVADVGGFTDFEGTIIGFVGKDKVKIKGIGYDKGKTETIDGNYVVDAQWFEDGQPDPEYIKPGSSLRHGRMKKRATGNS